MARSDLGVAVALILLRHGESTGNVAREAAEAEGLQQIPLECRDADIPLSELGIRQARAAGKRLRTAVGDLDRVQIWSSPYVRARQTAEYAAEEAGLRTIVRLDERLRDRELGILDTFTSLGIRSKFPEEAARRASLGKFYYRPPGGESWADIALRLRSALPALAASDVDVCVFTHDAVIAVCRYIIENLCEGEILDLAAREPVGNASISRCSPRGSGSEWQFDIYNDQAHLVAADGTDLRTQHPGERDVHPN
ncbi:MAG: histidine phosphatase family protein [Frankiales bacterium]|nr:histidine phosphatase family protein [Frankiales bacterium]